MEKLLSALVLAVAVVFIPGGCRNKASTTPPKVEEKKPTPEEAATKAIIKATRDNTDAFNKKDIEGYLRVCSVSEADLEATKKALADNYEKADITLTLSNEKVEKLDLSNGTADESFSQHSAVVLKANGEKRESDMKLINHFKLVNGQWKITATEIVKE